MGEALELIRAIARSTSRAERKPLEGVVRIRCEGRRGIHTGFLRDLSTAGMFVRILDPELPGRRLDFDLDLQLAGGRRRISGAGEVVWCRAGYEGPARPPGMGVRFLRLEPVAQEWLDDALGARMALPPLHDPLIPPPDALTLRGSTTTVRARLGLPFPSWRWAAWLALLALAGTGHAGWPGATASGEVPAGVATGASESQATATPATLTEAPTGVLAEWLDSLRDPRPVPPAGAAHGVLGTEAVAEELPSGRAAPARSAPNSAGAAAALPKPMGRVTDIRWATTAGGTLLTIEGDGVLTTSRLRSSGIRGETPRRVLQLRGVHGESRRYEVDTPELLRVRVGYHPEGEGALHVVLDLASGEVTTSPPELLGGEVRLLLSLPVGASPGTSGPASAGAAP